MGTSYQDIPLLKYFYVKTYFLGNVFHNFIASYIRWNVFYVVIWTIPSHKPFFPLSFSCFNLFHIVLYYYNSMNLHFP